MMKIKKTTPNSPTRLTAPCSRRLAAAAAAHDSMESSLYPTTTFAENPNPPLVMAPASGRSRLLLAAAVVLHATSALMQIHTRLAGAILKQAMLEAQREKNAYLAEANRLLVKAEECVVPRAVADAATRRIDALLQRLALGGAKHPSVARGMDDKASKLELINTDRASRMDPSAHTRAAARSSLGSSTSLATCEASLVARTTR